MLMVRKGFKSKGQKHWKLSHLQLTWWPGSSFAHWTLWRYRKFSRIYRLKSLKFSYSWLSTYTKFIEILGNAIVFEHLNTVGDFHFRSICVVLSEMGVIWELKVLPSSSPFGSKLREFKGFYSKVVLYILGGAFTIYIYKFHVFLTTPLHSFTIFMLSTFTNFPDFWPITHLGF